MLGQVIHGYRVDRVLSADKGGFGEVFLATHMESGAEAVVKVLRAEMSANHDTVTRFFNEARAAASIHHPGIVAIHNVGYHGDRAYLLMERLRGDDLQTRLEAGPLPLDRALVFMRQTAGAIAAAHERGIVHRDLKPANLFVVTDPDVIGGERVKVLDFGIAKLGGGANPGATQGVFGTPMYMSPEQCANTGAVDHRSDLYSLGCIFYELATGRPPFGRGGIELIAAHLRDAPVPPRAIHPAVPPAIEALILSLLEKDPARRLQSCAALVRALEGAASQAGISLGPAQSTPPVLAMAPMFSGAASAIQKAPTVTFAPEQRTRRGWIAIVVAISLAVVAATAIAVGLGRRGSGGVDSRVAIGNSSDARTIAGTPTFDAQVRAVVTDASPVATIGEPSPDDRARTLVDEAKALLYANPPQPNAAADKLRAAIALHPTAPEYLDLAIAEYQVGGLGAALLHAKAVEKNHPTPTESANALKLISAIEAALHKQGLDPDSATTIAKANDLNTQGKKLLLAKPPQYEQALALFEQANELYKDPMILFNMGMAQQQLHRCTDARKSYEAMIATGKASAKFVKFAQDNLKLLGSCR